MTRLPDVKNLDTAIDEIFDEIWLKKNITLSILRLDLIHPFVSGNKLFKLHYFLQNAIASHTKIITFGGAHSNHLSATAWACRHSNVPCIGIVRGEESVVLSGTLSFCREQGMRLAFISREEYKKKEEKSFPEKIKDKFGKHILIPEGGFSNEGIRGAALINKYIEGKKFTHICCSVGTGTTLAGLIISSDPSLQILGFSALKIFNFEERISQLTGNASPKNYHLIYDYHFGGYAKKTQKLIDFINTFYKEHQIPFDFVYTGKMMYGIIDLIKKDRFPTHSKLLCIHTGGLQGNMSLPPGVLNF